MLIEIAVGIAILVVMVFLATIDLAFSQLSDVGLRRLSAESEETRTAATSEFLREILEHRPRFRFALSATIQLLLIGFTVVVTLIVLRFTNNHTELVLYALVIGVVSTVLCRQVLPRLLIRNNPEGKLMLLLPVVRPLYRLASIFIRPLNTDKKAREQQKLESTVTPDTAEERADDAAEDFHALMEVGEAEGIIEENERELIESVVEFNETRAAEIMTPRTEICAVPINITIRAARDLMIEEKYSRLPVYRDTIDNVEGVIYVRDLLQAWADGKEEMPISTILRPPYFVPETKSAAELLKSMQSNHIQIAVVIDEYGGVAGLVSVEDILEEIVGEIEDEDTEDEEIIEIIESEGGYWDVLGSTEIDKIERLFDVELEDSEFTTIAGLITTEAGYVPKSGDRLTLRGLEIEIIRAEEKRINLVRLRKAEPENAEIEPAEA